ncbi:hypothetical protein L6R52_43815, partial [Myxococcota bacterium]|nr:hypothetical protein [Myxococcota bacterium]
MRLQLTLQLSAGLAALFGFGYVTAKSYVEPPAQIQIERTAAAQADAITTDVALEWLKLQTNLRALARAVADGPVVASLGASVSNAEARPAALKSA